MARLRQAPNPPRSPNPACLVDETHQTLRLEFREMLSGAHIGHAKAARQRSRGERPARFQEIEQSARTVGTHEPLSTIKKSFALLTNHT
jgi:hypothetical protein